MNRVRCLLVAFVLFLAAGCTPSHVITGEPVVFRVDSLTGQVTDRDVAPTSQPSPSGTIPHKGEIVTIVVNNVFVRTAQNLMDRHLLVYAEVYDDGQDDPTTAVSKVLFNQQGQSAGVNLGMADRILYGPTPFKGFPIRIRFYIVQLAKGQKAAVSRVLDAAGTLASGAQPQAAPAVGIIVRAAQLINALTKDDFELRFDLTLYPVDQIGRATTADEVLTAFKEPINRLDMNVTQVAALRTGSYVIFKRELGERFRTEKERAEHMVSTRQFDWAQQGFVQSYGLADGRGRATVHEVLRLQGGYLWRIIREVSAGRPPTTHPTTQVVMTQGPNKDVKVAIGPGYRQMFTDQTYVVISLVPGLPLGLGEQAMRAASRRDAERIASLLDNPENLSESERLSGEVEKVASSIRTQVEVRRLSQEAARRVGRDPNFRISADYPAYWVAQLVPTAGLKDEDRQNAEAQNSAVLSVLSDIIVNLPILRANSPGLGTLRGLQASHFSQVEQTDSDGKKVLRKGVFKINDDNVIRQITGQSGSAERPPTRPSS